VSRIPDLFAELKSRGEKALIPFITAGDPTLDQTDVVLDALVKGGADLIELGVPYSDPMADGPVIQRSSERALQGGCTLADILETVRRFRQRHPTPLILFGYLNPFLQHGVDRLARDAREAGVDGFLIVDLPPEEAESFQRSLAAQDLDLIALLTPTSDAERVDAVRPLASGFVYYVSVKGVTGDREEHQYSAIAERVAGLQGDLTLPIAVGFGIATPDQAAEVAEFADAVVVGSALIRVLESQETGEQAAEAAQAFLASLKSAMSA